MCLLIKSKELQDNLFPKTQKWVFSNKKWPKILIFYNDFILPNLWSIQLIRMHLFLKIKELWVYLVHEDPKNEHLSTKNAKKMALNGQDGHFSYINSTLTGLTSIQLIAIVLILQW